MRLALVSLRIGLDSLRAYPMRTALSTLGVLIGVASLVAILALGDGLESYSREQLAGTTDVQAIVVEPRTVALVDGVAVERPDAVALTPARADSLAAAIGERAHVALALTGSAWGRVRGDTAMLGIVVTATTPGFSVAGDVTVLSGRFLAAGDGAATPPAVVVNQSLAERLARGGDAVGRTLALDGVQRAVVGVVRNPGRALRAYVPLDSAAQARLGGARRQLPAALVRVARVEDVEAVEATVRRWLSRYGDVDREFAVQSSLARARQARLGILVFKLVMGSIAGIALLVGGIGIMNILLAAVAERTREIGIRKAVGARRGDVMSQFLFESVLIAGVGALLGVVLGLSAAFGITAVIRHTTDAPIRAGFSWGSVVVAAVMALVVGIGFGTYPALRAARLSPVDAIRHE
jgi:putative ABC transport system permease protein